MRALDKELKEKIEAVSTTILSGQPQDYAAYREAVGRLATLRELTMFVEERKRLSDGDDSDD
jgi:hypothetical protein